MLLWLDECLGGAVLDVDAVDGQPGDVVGDLVRIVGEAALQPCQGRRHIPCVGQQQRRFALV
jgi:hypothetical protein